MQSFFTQKTQKSLQTRQTFKHIIWMMSWSCLRINLIWFPFSVNWLKVIKQSRSKWNRCHVYPLLLSRSTTTSMATSLATMSWRRHSAWPSTITFQTFQSAGTKTRQKRQKDGKKKTQIDNFQIARVNVKVSRTSAMLHLGLSVSCCFKLNFLSIETKGCGGRRICNLQIKTIPGKWTR